MILDAPELVRIEAKLDAILATEKLPEIPEWTSIRMASVIKGGCALNTLLARRYLQPNAGRYDAYVGGVGVFSRTTIIEWLAVTDADLEAYHRAKRTGCPVPEPKGPRKAPRRKTAS